MYRMTDEDFEVAVSEALDSMPARFMDELDNIVIMVADEPDEEQLELFDYGTSTEDGNLLGLYDGVPLSERAGSYGELGGDYPDSITIFQGPHERSFNSREEIVEEVRKTIVHEIGHFFGLNEQKLASMGYE